MTDAGIIKDMEACAKQSCSECSMYGRIEIEGYCDLELMKEALDLIKRQQEWFETIKKAFRAEFEEKMELGIEDCINWADWLDSIAEEVKEGKYDDR